jgi:hypothetical protein
MSANYAEATIEWGANSITLLELMKQELGITDNAQDVQLSMYLQMAGDASESYCDNVLASFDTSEQHAISFDPIALRYYPVTALNAVTIDGDDLTANYDLYESEGVDYITASPSGIRSGFSQVNIAYTAGYDPLPTDLGFAVVQAGVSYQIGSSAGTVKKESVVGVGSVEYSVDDTSGSASRVGQLLSAAVAVLENYRRRYL